MSERGKKEKENSQKMTFCMVHQDRDNFPRIQVYNEIINSENILIHSERIFKQLQNKWTKAEKNTARCERW